MLLATATGLCAGLCAGLAAEHDARTLRRRVPLALPLAIGTLYAACYASGAAYAEVAAAGRWHISSLLSRPVMYELGAVAAAQLAASSVCVAVTLHRQRAQLEAAEGGPARDAGHAIGLVVAHLTVAPLVVGTALTVHKRNALHMPFAVPFFGAAVLLVAMQALEAFHGGWVPSAQTYAGLVLSGVAIAHVPEAVRELRRDSATPSLAVAEVAGLTALALVYGDAELPARQHARR